MKRWLFAVVGWGVSIGAFAQSSAPATPTRPEEAGRPLLRNYSAKEYGAHYQNWAAVQDRRGLMYFANSRGILEYDGVSWRVINTPNNNVARSIEVDADGHIYVGLLGNFGYLGPDEKGRMEFKSLLDHVPEGDRGFADVWRTFATPQGVYFQSQTRLFRWANNQMRVWKPTAERFHRAGMIGDSLYIGQPGIGLMTLDHDELKRLPGTERFADEVFPVLVSYDDRQILIGTRADGLFLYDGVVARPMKTEVDDFLRANSLYRGIWLPDGSLALSTIGGGLVVIDKSGHRRTLVDKDTGLVDNSVHYAYPDREGGLWLALDTGIARVEINSPFSIFPEQSGISGGVTDLKRFNGRLYLTMANGLAYLEPQSSGADVSRRWAGVRPVSGVSTQCWGLLEFTDPDGRSKPQLLLAASDGLFTVEGDHATVVVSSTGRSYNVSTLLPSRKDPYRVWVGLFDGLASVRFVNGRWVNEGRVEDVTNEVRSLVEDDDGRLWAGTSASGALRLDFSKPPFRTGTTLSEHPIIERFGEKDGLRSGGVGVTSIGGRPLFGNGQEGETFRFDESRRAFVVDPVFNKLVPNDPFTFGSGFSEDSKGNVYVNLGRETAVAFRQADGKYVVDRERFLRLTDFALGAIYAEDDGVVWFGGRTTLRYDNALDRKIGAPFSALIRQVTAGGSVLSAGDAVDAGPPSIPRLDSSVNALRFEFAAPSFDSESSTQFQSFLEGLDKGWSEWSREAKRDYTNLGFGDYRFHLRAKNLYGRQSSEAVYAFNILPPWYRTWWAYVLYALVGALGVFVIDRVQRRRVTSKERERSHLPGSAASRRGRRDTCQIGGRAEEERRAARADRPRDHGLARSRHDLPEAVRACEPAGRCRCLRRGPLPSGKASDRISPGSRERQALRAVQPRYE